MKCLITYLTFLLFSFINTSTAHESIQLGTQVWMKKNYASTVFRNGDTIFHVKTAEVWVKAGQNGISAWCHYDTDENNEDIHGILYKDYI